MSNKRKRFIVKPFTNIDKYVVILGPDYFRLMVDFDDVNQAEVRKQIKQMVAILDEHWVSNAEKVDQEKAKSRTGRSSQS